MMYLYRIMYPRWTFQFILNHLQDGVRMKCISENYFQVKIGKQK